MKLVDHNGRLFGKISVIDLLVVLVVAVMAVALQVKNHGLEATSTSVTDQTITFTAVAENVSLHVVDALQVGDQLFDKDRSSGGAIGTITNIEVQPAGRIMSFVDGTYARTPNENARTLILTVEGKGTVTDGRYAFNRVYELGVNSARTLVTRYTLVTLSVTDIW